jgi:hypothetical protein
MGGSLNENCVRFPGDTCVSDICNGPPPPGDPYCCDLNQGEWDDNCIDQVLTICLEPTCAALCKHSPCETGIALDPLCNSCTALVCFQDPNCCIDDGDPMTDDWDASCILKVEQECKFQCDEPGENVCGNAHPITKGRYFGTLIGASNDGCATENGAGGAGVSCRSGDVWYSYTQVAADDMKLSMCATQRGFGVDATLSVHEGCPGKRNNEIVSNDDHFLGLLPLECQLDASPIHLDSAVSLGGSFALAAGETVLIRVSHHDDTGPGGFEFRLLPEPELWMALAAGVGALGVLSRRRARS